MFDDALVHESSGAKRQMIADVAPAKPSFANPAAGAAVDRL
jgi:hypothetical protein